MYILNEGFQIVRVHPVFTLDYKQSHIDSTVECIELPNSEREEILRDKTNKLGRADIEVFDEYLIKERIMGVDVA